MKDINPGAVFLLGLIGGFVSIFIISAINPSLFVGFLMFVVGVVTPQLVYINAKNSGL